MNIFKVADEQSIPSWLIPEEDKTPVEEVESINISEEVTDKVLVQECDRIEACSVNGHLYHYNSKWDDGTVRHLREYAIACGMDLGKFRGFDPSVLQKEAESEGMVKTAQVASTETQELRNVMGDPFHIEERSDMSHMEMTNWQEVKKQNVLAEPTLDTGSVISIGGGEDYNLNSDVNPAANQNSMTNPFAIEQLAKSDVDDTGERLRKEREAKETQKKADHEEWQQDKIDAMAGNDIIPKGSVFPTEALNANTGLNNPSSQAGVYAEFDPNSIPEQTAGEKIASSNKAYKESIQRPKETDDWQKPCGQTARGISSSFGDSLAALLNK